jgi:hypothetical protein
MQGGFSSAITMGAGGITVTNLVADFVELCEFKGLDTQGGLAELNAQNWDDDSDPITDEQLKEINRLMRLIVGEPTNEQMEAIFRSVMLA